MNFKNTIILGMFFCLCIPFVLLNNFYPFWRFGMFAEPVKSQIQTEQFKVYRKLSNGRIHYFSPEYIGFDENQFLYIARNYYYKSQTTFFLKEISHLYFQEAGPPKLPEEWQLYRYVITWQLHKKTQNIQDSLLTQTLKVNDQ